MRTSWASVATGRRIVAAGLVVVAVVWVRVNGPVEGPVLIVFSRTHGLTTADLPAIAAVVVAGWLAWPRRRAATRPADDPGAERHP